MELRYAILAGQDGFVAGQARYRWHADDGRYSLTSSAEAVGLTAFFVSGRIVQVSEGRLAADGLWPEEFWMGRNERKQESARFDWAAGELRLSSGGAPYPLTAQAQDLLSFPFHLAMTAHPEETAFDLWVSDGRRFREYRFHNLGRTRLALGERQVDALHLQGRRAQEGTLDVWLDLGQSGLPVKVQTQDHKGKTFILLLEGVQAGAG
jgi:hypothetical protein